MIYKFYVFLLFISMTSCQKNIRHEAIQIVEEWQNKKILFTKESESFISSGTSSYKILVYVDSIGCGSCKLQLNKWNEFIKETTPKPKFLFCINSNDKKEINFIRKKYQFFSPIYQDMHDSLNKLNHFPKDERFHTFLLDSNNRIKVIGNPIHNPQIKELYLKIIRGDSIQSKKIPLTIVDYDITTYNLGKFSTDESKKAIFSLKNKGTQPLLIKDVTTSCGCATPIYDRQPIEPGKISNIIVEMKMKKEGYFEKTILVYTNTPDSPLFFKIKGNICNKNNFKYRAS